MKKTVETTKVVKHYEYYCDVCGNRMNSLDLMFCDVRKRHLCVHCNTRSKGELQRQGMVIVMSDEPNYVTDVQGLKSGFNMWERTYEYRDIKYNIAILQREHSRWVVVEFPEETLDIVELVWNAGIVCDFLYHIFEHKEGDSLREVFYKAVMYAEADINWFLDDCLDDIVREIKYYNSLYDNVSSTIDSISE